MYTRLESCLSLTVQHNVRVLVRREQIFLIFLVERIQTREIQNRLEKTN